MVVSFFSTWQRQRYWAAQLASSAADLNIAAAQAIVDGYCGISYLTELLFSNATVIFVLLLIVGFGFYAVRHTLQTAQTEQVSKTLLRTALCCAVPLSGITLLLMLLFPSKGVRPITMDLYALRYAADWQILLILLLQVMIISVVTALCAALIRVSMPLFRQPYLALGMPLILYFVLHLLVGAAGWISPTLRMFAEVFLLDSALLALYSCFSSTAGLGMTAIQLIGFPLLTALLCTLIYKTQKNTTRT